MLFVTLELYPRIAVNRASKRSHAHQRHLFKLCIVLLWMLQEFRIFPRFLNMHSPIAIPAKPVKIGC
jgi:hypothetical protein